MNNKLGIIEFNPKEIYCGSGIRNVLPKFYMDGFIKFDTKIKAKNNNLVLCDVLSIPSSRKKRLAFRSNMIERAYLDINKNKLILKNETLKKKMAIVTIGSRYSSLSYAGGLYNPITKCKNNDIYCGSVIQNLGRMNVAGYVNYNYGEEKPIQLKVKGVLMDRRKTPINLINYRRIRVSNTCSSISTRKRYTILIIGIDMESGKTTCATGISKELKKKGYKTTFEKRTGGPFCRDWINVISGSMKYGEIPSTVTFNINKYSGWDFVDSCGIISSDTYISKNKYINHSNSFLQDYFYSMQNDFHIIELAGNLSEEPNLFFLMNKIFKSNIDVVIFTSPINYESVHQFLYYFVNHLGFNREQLIISGPLGNYSSSEFVKTEVKQRLKIPICNSIKVRNETILPEGSELLDVINKKIGDVI